MEYKWLDFHISLKKNESFEIKAYTHNEGLEQKGYRSFNHTFINWFIYLLFNFYHFYIFQHLEFNLEVDKQKKFIQVSIVGY